MEKVSDNLLLFSRNLQANGAQFFWDTLYILNKPMYIEKSHSPLYLLKRGLDRASVTGQFEKESISMTPFLLPYLLWQKITLDFRTLFRNLIKGDFTQSEWE